jgi:hypothetical protein
MIRRLAGAILGFHRDEEGTYWLATGLALIPFVIIANMLLNILHAVDEKVELQNTVDSATHAASLEMARGMNSVTAANHLVGELQALTVLHHSLGGYEIEGQSDPWDRSATPRRRQRRISEISGLRAAYFAARLSRPIPPVFEPAWTLGSDNTEVGGAIDDARSVLRGQLTATFQLHAIGGWLEKDPRTFAIGFRIATAAFFQEIAIWRELVYIKGLETAARAMTPLKRTVERVTMPAVQLYARAVIQRTPGLAREAARRYASRQYAAGELWPNPDSASSGARLRLPLRQDPAPIRSRHAQLIRSSYPWVVYGKAPLVQVMWPAAPMSRLADFYCKYSNVFSHRKAWDRRTAWRRSGDDLWMIEDTSPPSVEKGREPWTRMEGSRRADELFALLGFARRDVKVFGAVVFRNPHDQGFVTFAQGMIYNANPQHPGALAGMQPVVGWDTLNWDHRRIPELPDDCRGAFTDGCGCHQPGVPAPEIRLNWQAKLMPATRIDEDGPRRAGGFVGRTAGRLIRGRDHSNTH